MNIEMWDINKLVPFKSNPRLISDEAVQQVANSIQEVGFRQPIVVNKEGIIIVGHTRLLAAKSLNMATVPVHIADIPKASQDRYRLRDNKSGEFSKWDLDILSVEWEAPELEELGFDMSSLGIQEDIKDISENYDNQYKIEIDCIDELDQEKIYNKLKEEGYKCQILTL